MKRVIRADNLLVATLWQRMLASAEIQCEIRNRFVGSAIGELPVDSVQPELWVVEDRDFERAAEMLAELAKPSPLPPWRCTRCDEAVEGQFFQCWQCEGARP